MEKITGRIHEKKILGKAITSTEASLIAMYGRRRVGKTFLVRSFYKDIMAFEFTGIHEASLNDQLQNFSLSLSKKTGAAIPPAIPKNWIEAFHFLQRYIESKIVKNKQVIFLMNFPGYIHQSLVFYRLSNISGTPGFKAGKSYCSDLWICCFMDDRKHR